MSTSVHTPDKKALRSFGQMFGIVLAVLFGLLIPTFRHGSEFALWPVWPWVAGALIFAWAWLHPATLVWLYRPWMRFARIAQWVNTRLIMLLLFYAIILPIGLLMRLLGKDPMQRRRDATADSYRVGADKRERDHMDQPY